MDTLLGILLSLASDKMMFSLLQVALVCAFFIALVNKYMAQWRAGKGSLTLAVKRGSGSMSKFYGAYIALNGLLVAICLSVDTTEGYQIFWVLFDTLIPAYLCILNSWSRNKLIGCSHVVSEIEKR
jgi:hypothetical protein